MHNTLKCNNTLFWSGNELGLGHCLKCPWLLYHAMANAIAELHFLAEMRCRVGLSSEISWLLESIHYGTILSSVIIFHFRIQIDTAG